MSSEEDVIWFVIVVMIEPLLPVLEKMADAVEAMVGPEAINEVIRRRHAGECVAHDSRGVTAVTVYDDDPVCEDCAVDYLHEDLSEDTT